MTQSRVIFPNYEIIIGEISHLFFQYSFFSEMSIFCRNISSLMIQKCFTLWLKLKSFSYCFFLDFFYLFSVISSTFVKQTGDIFQVITICFIYTNLQNSCYFSSTAQETKFSIKDFFSKCDQIRSLLLIWSYLLKKSLMKNFIVGAVQGFQNASWKFFCSL